MQVVLENSKIRGPYDRDPNEDKKRVKRRGREREHTPNSENIEVQRSLKNGGRTRTPRTKESFEVLRAFRQMHSV